MISHMSDDLVCDKMRGIPGIRSDHTCLMGGRGVIPKSIQCIARSKLVVSLGANMIILSPLLALAANQLGCISDEFGRATCKQKLINPALQQTSQINRSESTPGLICFYGLHAAAGLQRVRLCLCRFAHQFSSIMTSCRHQRYEILERKPDN